MRVAIAALYLGLAATVQSVSAEVKKANRDWFAATPDAQPTYFDGKQVPALPVLTDEAAFNQTKYLVVKFASPYSPHCVQFKPTYQTIYEYYYTSDIPVNHDVALPAPAATTFEEYYGLKFYTVDCINTDKICRQQGIIAYPTTILYKNGELVTSVRGAKNMTIVADLIENALESEYPGTRPLHPLLPAAGASSRPVPENVPQGEVPTDESQKPLNAGERSV